MKIFLSLFLSILLLNVKGEIYYVTNMTELNQANKVALPGDKIVLKNGLWNNCHFNLQCKGTEIKPITITAETPGKVIISGNSFLKIGGEYITINGLYFKDGSSLEEDTWEFKIDDQVANHCRITNCKIENFNNPRRFQENNWVVMYGKQNRIDHCSFTHKTNLGVLLAVKMDDERSRESYHRIDSNYFGIRLPLGSNGGEIIRVGLAQHSQFNSRTIIKNNFFENCDGETEIISIKSCGNFVQQNLFLSCQGAVVLRHGNNNTVEGNIFDGQFKKGTGGVRIINEGNWVANNVMIHCRGEGFRAPLSIMNGVYNSPPTRYVPVKNALVLNNTFVNCSPISLGEGADSERSIPPNHVYFIHNLLENNIDSVILSAHSSTDGFTFKNNITNIQPESPYENGFSKKSFLHKRFHNKSIIPYTTRLKDSVQLPIHFLSEVPYRLLLPVNNQAGVTDLNFFNKLLELKKNTRISWKQKAVNRNHKEMIFTCKNVKDIINYIQRYKNCKLILTESVYHFNEPVIIQNSITISSKNGKILFEGENNLSSFFLMTKNSSLHLDGIHFLSPINWANCFISTDTSLDCNHYQLKITNCTFDNVHMISNAFFYAKKTSYADVISIEHCQFNEANGKLFSLMEESDKKGYYNAENIEITNCVFKNGKHSIIEIHRGGTDESTMGPIVTFNNNQLIHCNQQQALLYFSGVQQSELYNNLFDHSNEGNIVIQYEDNTKSVHYQKNNDFKKSGYISENKFVNNLK